MLLTLLTLHNLKVVGAVLTSIVSVASAFCASTPTPPANTAWGKFYKLVEFAAMNIGKAKQVAKDIEADTKVIPPVNEVK